MARRQIEQQDDLDTRLGREDAPGGSVEVWRTGEGHPLLLPSAYRRLDEEQREVIAELQDIAALISKGAADLEVVVREARESGISWDLIGWSIGRTGRAASMRWGDRS